MKTKWLNSYSVEKRVSLNKWYCFETFWEIPSYFAFLKGSFKLLSDDYYFKFGFCFLGDYFFNFSTYWNRKMDHAGFTFEFTLFGLSVYNKIYDERHWDFENDDWKNTYISD